MPLSIPIRESAGRRDDDGSPSKIITQLMTGDKGGTNVNRARCCQDVGHHVMKNYDSRFPDVRGDESNRNAAREKKNETKKSKDI